MVSYRLDKEAGVSQFDHSLRDHTSGTHSNFLQRKKLCKCKHRADKTATHWSPMQPKIRHWRLNSQNWPPPGKLQKLQGNHNTRQNCFSFTRCHIVSAGSSENGITGALHRHVLLWRWMPISCWNNYMRFSQMGY